MPDNQHTSKTNFAETYPWTRTLINITSLMTLTLFITSLFSPLFTLEKFYFFSNTVSVLSALISLLDEGHLFLFVIIFIFSILFPLFKLSIMLYIWNSEAGEVIQKLLKLIHHLGKWSMLDVFVVALLVVSIKFDQMAEMKIHYGLYLFLSAVVLSMLISAISTRFLEKHHAFQE